MSSLEPRGGRRMSRRAREDRAYALLLASGGAGALAVVALVLSVVGVVSFGLVILLAIVAVVAGLLFRRTVAAR